mgnify:CR=1 FL=1
MDIDTPLPATPNAVPRGTDTKCDERSAQDEPAVTGRASTSSTDTTLDAAAGVPPTVGVPPSPVPVDLQEVTAAGNWFLFNDATVTATSFSTLASLSLQFPTDLEYMLFYRRCTDDDLQGAVQGILFMKLRMVRLSEPLIHAPYICTASHSAVSMASSIRTQLTQRVATANMRFQQYQEQAAARQMSGV